MLTDIVVGIVIVSAVAISMLVLAIFAAAVAQSIVERLNLIK